METVWKFFKKLKLELLFDPAIQQLGIYPKSPETQFQRIYAPYVHSSAIYNRQDLEIPYVSISR